MRRLVLIAGLLLVFAACSKDDGGGVFNAGDTTSSSASGATTAAPGTTAPPIVEAGKDRVEEGIARGLKKDPGQARVQTLGKTTRVNSPRAGGTGGPPAPPDTRGDDPRLDALWEDCANGDMAACDDLYRESPSGSVYEEFGATCGGTTAGTVWCTDVEQPGEPSTYGDDPYLDGLWDDCAAGDMAACDSLYLEAPVESEYESYGATCGGQTDGSAWCVDEFPAGDPRLDDLQAACAAGDMEACDTLYVEAPAGSDYEEFGATCGGITDGSRWCVDEFGEPVSYGDDPHLDGLWDACEAGFWAACDSLFMESPVGSDYEQFGATCGFLTDGSEWCVDASLGDPFTLGDDPYLDGLWRDCAAGDWAACDQLFWDSPIGSDYEQFGGTCGGLTDGTEFCVDVDWGGGGTGDPFTLGDDPYLDGLWRDCAAGDWAACDQLYWDSPIDSEYEEFGGTCGYLTDGSQSCVDVNWGGGSVSTFGDDPYLDDLWKACEAGDWAACDDLYNVSPAGSDYEEFGATCGYLTDGSEWCVNVDWGSGSPNSFGDDAYLDGLWTACESGDWAACDELYNSSPAGSEYEQFGLTCGYLTDGSQWCVDVNWGGGAAFTYGDDPYLDGLWDACAAGDWAACDELYSASPSGSDYEDFGGTCGNLTDGSQWCVDVNWGGGAAFTYGDDPYLDGLWDACAAGDWAACDQLYWDAPIDSEYEDFGSTCGYRTDGADFCVNVMTSA